MDTKKPKITKMGNPDNPYTKKKVSAAEARASAKATGNNKPKPKPKAAKKVLQKNVKKAAGMVEGYKGADWRRNRDAKIKAAGG